MFRLPQKRLAPSQLTGLGQVYRAQVCINLNLLEAGVAYEVRNGIGPRTIREVHAAKDRLMLRGAGGGRLGWRQPARPPVS